jgi:hypothetical protein
VVPAGLVVGGGIWLARRGRREGLDASGRAQQIR